MRNLCPNDEILMDFVEGRLSERQRSKIEVHLAACDLCREQVGACAELLYRDVALDEVQAPEHLTQLAVDRVSQLSATPGPGVPRAVPKNVPKGVPEGVPEGVIDQARRWLAKGVAVLERIVPQGEPEWVAVRGDATTSDHLIRREKRFGDAALTIEIEKSGDGQALIRVALTELDRTDEPLRVALFKGEREVASMMLGAAPVVFEEIAFGVYSLLFARGNAKIGEYTFEVTERSETE